MNLKKMLIIAGLTGMVANTAMAAQGDISIIPQLKLGTGEADAGYFGEDDINVYGIAADYLYGVNNNFELGVGLGIDKNELDDNSELDFTSFNIYGIGRYNFDTTNGYTPYISAKLGYKNGDEDTTYVSSGITGKLEIETGLFSGIALGIEYNYVNFELGYEHTEADVDDTWNGSHWRQDADIDVFYMAVGYRFNY
jgi:hypothetical protein